MYNTGLPARIHAVKLLPWYRNGKIRSATDQSVWESPFYEASTPMAIPAVQKQYLFCDRDTAYFTDLSVLKETGATWSWSFPGGTPSTSSIRTPKVVYNSPGIYDVSLIIHDVNGNDTATITGMIIADNKCAIDTTPGGAMDIVSHPGHLKVEDMNFTTQTVTITAWIKPNGIQSEYSGIWMNDGTAAGLNFRETNNTLGYHWPGGSWSWDSNLTVPPNEWSYVAMVVTPGSVKVYVNGISATHTTAIQSVTLNDIRIGSYQNWEARTYKGQIDEVCVWNRALTEDEIRLQRHLVKQPANDPTIVSYHQFDNLLSGDVIDKANGIDGTLVGSANIVSSDAPLGSGTSQILLVQNSGNAIFNNGGDLAIGFKANHPNGKVVVSHLHVLPDTMPLHAYSQGAYWIVNNYGSNQVLSGLDSVRSYAIGSLSNAMADNFQFKLYARPSNGTGPNWIMLPTDSIVPSPGLNTTIKGMNLLTIKSLGQFLVMRDTVTSGTADVAITSPNQPDLQVEGGESISLLIHSDHQGLQLPVLSGSALTSLGAPVAGQMAFLSDSASVVYYNGTKWMLVNLEPVLQYGNPTPPVDYNSISIPNASSNESSLIILEGGLVHLPVFTLAALLDVELLAPGMMVFESATGKIRCYNGNVWQALSATETNLAISVAPATLVTGVAINQSTKNPSSVLEINAAGGKAFQLPKVDPDQIYNPVTGLICFNPLNNKLMLYDGIRWNVIL